MRQLFQRALRKLHRLGQGSVESLSPLLSYGDRTQLFSAHELLRLGTKYGGWIIPVNCGLSSSSVCYSSGAGEDSSFDCALVERFRCRICILDPTPRAIQHFNRLERAVKLGGRCPINNSSVDYYSLAIDDLTRLQFLPIGLASTDAELKFYLPQNPAYVSCSTLIL